MDLGSSYTMRETDNRWTTRASEQHLETEDVRAEEEAGGEEIQTFAGTGWSTLTQTKKRKALGKALDLQWISLGY